MTLERIKKQFLELDDDTLNELKVADPVIENITVHKFVSYSKGWRYHKDGTKIKRYRCRCKEIYLIHSATGNMTGRKFNQYHHFPFDVVAQEIFNDPNVETYKLQNRINDLWGYPEREK